MEARRAPSSAGFLFCLVESRRAKPPLQPKQACRFCRRWRWSTGTRRNWWVSIQKVAERWASRSTKATVWADECAIAATSGTTSRSTPPAERRLTDCRHSVTLMPDGVALLAQRRGKSGAMRNEEARRHLERGEDAPDEAVDFADQQIFAPPRRSGRAPRRRRPQPAAGAARAARTARSPPAADLRLGRRGVWIGDGSMGGTPRGRCRRRTPPGADDRNASPTGCTRRRSRLFPNSDYASTTPVRGPRHPPLKIVRRPTDGVGDRPRRFPTSLNVLGPQRQAGLAGQL
jgi:hypothetical protein